MVMASGNDPSFAREMTIRKRIARIYNKREEDFSSLREYNDYLEEVEDMIFNLIEGIDVPVIEARIAKYQVENAEQIIISSARKAEEDAAALRASKGAPQPDGNEMNGDQGQGYYAPTAHPGGGFAQPRPTGMAPQPLPMGGGGMFNPLQGLDADDEEKLKIKAERGALAGGWMPELGRRRAFEEAFSSIWV